MRQCVEKVFNYFSLQPEEGLSERLPYDVVEGYFEKHRFCQISGEEYLEGDVLLFKLVGEWHMGVYVGDGMFKHTFGKRGDVLSRVGMRWWKDRLVSAWRRNDE
jgi:hypothetical protein